MSWRGSTQLRTTPLNSRLYRADLEEAHRLDPENYSAKHDLDLCREYNGAFRVAHFVSLCRGEYEELTMFRNWVVKPCKSACLCSSTSTSRIRAYSAR